MTSGTRCLAVALPKDGVRTRPERHCRTSIQRRTRPNSALQVTLIERGLVDGLNSKFSVAPVGEAFAPDERMVPSVFVGRSAAMMCHPVLAWDRMRPAGRVALATGYATIAYVTALMVLVAL